MWQKIKQILIPTIILSVVAIIGMLIYWQRAQESFLADSNRETARLVSAIIEEYPEIEPEDLIKAMRNNSSSNVGDELLRRYGYRSTDFAWQSAKSFSLQFLISVITIFVLFVVTVIIYFLWQSYRRSKNLKQLINYLQDLSQHHYNLKLIENDEGELSLLSNEIYKITVLLKEAAEHDRALRQNLETALADISHQLRTPLTSIQVMLGNIYDDPDMPLDVRQDFLKTMRQQVESMSDLVTTLLSLARLDNKTIKMQNKEVIVSDILDQVVQNLEILADLRGVTLNITGDKLAKVKLDPRWQVEALTNIVKNSIEYSPSGREVLIEVKNCPLFLKITVQDFGQGMNRTELHHIFERFYRANDNSGGFGIGLSFAKAIIEANNGQITAKSKEGEGTMFTVTYFT